MRELAVSTASVQLNRPVRSIHDLPDARQLLASCRDHSIPTGVAGCGKHAVRKWAEVQAMLILEVLHVAVDGRVDGLLLGGLQLGTITELVGLSGAGKTQVRSVLDEFAAAVRVCDVI